METLETEYMKIIPEAGGADMQTTAKIETMRRFLGEYRRLKKIVKRANEIAEHFEREWYLLGDEIERLKTENALLTTVASAAKDIIDFQDLHCKYPAEHRQLREDKLKYALTCLPNAKDRLAKCSAESSCSTELK